MPIENPKPLSPAAAFLRRRDTWIRWVLESEMSLAARVVGVHLAMRMNVKDKKSWPNIKTIGKALQISARHAQRGMLELEKYGALRVYREKRESNRYYLRLPTDDDE